MINLLLFGAGVYVQGPADSKSQLGNIGAALVEALHQGLLSKVFIKATSSSSCCAAKKINDIVSQEFVYSCKNHDIDHNFILDNNITGAVVALPDHLHYEYLLKCADLGLHVICVKPFVETKQQAELLSTLYKSKNLYGFVEFHKRFDKQNILLKDDINGSSISRFFIDYSQDSRVPTNDFKQWSRRTNVFQYLGVHYVDLVHWMTRSTPIRINSYFSGTHLSSLGINTPDNIDVIVEWEGNNQAFTSVHLTSWSESHGDILPSRQTIQVLTNKSRIDLDQADRGYKRIVNGKVNIVNPYFSKQYILNGEKRYSGYGIDNYLYFFRLLRLNKKNSEFQLDDRLCTFDSALTSVMVTEKVSIDLANA